MKKYILTSLIILLVTSGILSSAQDAPANWWQVFFTEPEGGVDSTSQADVTNGIDQYLIQAIDQAKTSIDIAAFEFNLDSLATALINAMKRGVQVRMVTDDEYGLEDEDSTIKQLMDAGISVVNDGRSALMHNKFVVIDDKQVWTGSWNFTFNGTFRNNNNVIAIDSSTLAMYYTREFEEMFIARQFGSASPTFYDFEDLQQTMIDDSTVQVYFAPEDDVADWLEMLISDAQSSIRFMAFSFTHDGIGQAVLDQAAAGINVQGIFETRGSTTEYSELPAMFCNGISVRQDGNPRIFHHKVFIVDDETVVLGSFNFSSSADEDNDENILVIQTADIAAEYNAEFDRRWEESVVPEDISCEGIEVPNRAAVMVTVTSGAVNLRSGPGTNYSVAGNLGQDETVNVEGRNTAGDWLYLGNNQWVAAWVVSVEGDANSLNIIAAPTIPDQPAQPAPTQLPAEQPGQVPAVTQSPVDSDGDGVVDSADACPNQGNTGYGVQANGCPNPAPDSDGDGYPDNTDACPSQGDQGYGLAANGCPNPPPAPGWNCGGDIYNCGDFVGRCADLCAYQAACSGDPSRLDRDNDGWMCESQCGPCN